jgi:thiol:disulfide interchange protein DsbA
MLPSPAPSNYGVVMSRLVWIAAALLAVSSASLADVVPGKDFTTLRQPQTTEVPANKIEVIEFVNFACPGCNALHRPIMAWKAKLPADVTFRRVPIDFRKPGWGPLARAFYALEATGDLDRVDTALFDAVHKERQPLFDEKSITAWMVKHGVDGAKFTAAYNSFGVNTRVAQNDRIIARYEIGSVPSIVVDGRYMPAGNSYDEMLRNAAALIAKAKAERAAAKKS